MMKESVSRLYVIFNCVEFTFCMLSDTRCIWLIATSKLLMTTLGLGDLYAKPEGYLNHILLMA